MATSLNEPNSTQAARAGEAMDKRHGTKKLVKAIRDKPDQIESLLK
ncbi:hypothetical protein CCACVL1_24833 [Corchorus capsularis]|uniref:Uncharacterized protein n=1 Tax=Corchorus capsularis TaxID=210143 RepID=A0A1R3GMZ4_COCAP|nr:hypothetical protein CCACVL1_24833 [Corchorus capsularis]